MLDSDFLGTVINRVMLSDHVHPRVIILSGVHCILDKLVELFETRNKEHMCEK